MTFGRVPLTALARLTQIVDGEERVLGRDGAATVKAALLAGDFFR